MAQVMALLWFRSGLVRARVGLLQCVGFVSVDAGRFTFARGGKGRFNIARKIPVDFPRSEARRTVHYSYLPFRLRSCAHYFPFTIEKLLKFITGPDQNRVLDRFTAVYPPQRHKKKLAINYPRSVLGNMAGITEKFLKG